MSSKGCVELFQVSGLCKLLDSKLWWVMQRAETVTTGGLQDILETDLLSGGRDILCSITC